MKRYLRLRVWLDRSLWPLKKRKNEIFVIVIWKQTIWLSVVRNGASLHEAQLVWSVRTGWLYQEETAEILRESIGLFRDHKWVPVILRGNSSVEILRLYICVSCGLKSSFPLFLNIQFQYPYKHRLGSPLLLIIVSPKGKTCACAACSVKCASYQPFFTVYSWLLTQPRSTAIP